MYSRYAGVKTVNQTGSLQFGIKKITARRSALWLHTLYPAEL